VQNAGYAVGQTVAKRRIDELLNTKAINVNLTDKKIMVYEGEKNRKGCAVCFSNDAGEALDPKPVAI
jgi:hypothetical protein